MFTIRPGLGPSSGSKTLNKADPVILMRGSGLKMMLGPT